MATEYTGGAFGYTVDVDSYDPREDEEKIAPLVKAIERDDLNAALEVFDSDIEDAFGRWSAYVDWAQENGGFHKNRLEKEIMSHFTGEGAQIAEYVVKVVTPTLGMLHGILPDDFIVGAQTAFSLVVAMTERQLQMDATELASSVIAAYVAKTHIYNDDDGDES